MKKIWNFFTIFLFFLILKHYFQNLKSIFKFLMTWPVTSAPRDQSCTISNCHVAKTMPYQQKSGAKDLFSNNFFLQGCNSNVFLQGRKSYLSQYLKYLYSKYFTSLINSRLKCIFTLYLFQCCNFAPKKKMANVVPYL